MHHCIQATPLQNKTHVDSGVPMENVDKEKTASVMSYTDPIKNGNKREEKCSADEEFNIESLVEKKGSKYLVKWENYPSEQNTWEPRSGIPAFILNVNRPSYWYLNYMFTCSSFMRRIYQDQEILPQRNQR